MIGCLFHYKEEGMRLILENNIRQMTTTTTLTGQYPFHERRMGKIVRHLVYQRPGTFYFFLV